MPKTFTKLNIGVNAALLLILSLLIYADKPMSGVHTSTHLLKRLVEDELELVKNLNHYVSTVEDHANQVRNYIKNVYSNIWGMEWK